VRFGVRDFLNICQVLGFVKISQKCQALYMVTRAHSVVAGDVKITMKMFSLTGGVRLFRWLLMWSDVSLCL